MAFINESVSSVNDLFTKLDVFFANSGWTPEHLDITADAVTGGEWAMRRTTGATNIRFAMSWDASNTPDFFAIYQYVDQDYVISDRPWGQDNDSGNGFAGTIDSDIDDARHVQLGNAPIRYWAFSGVSPRHYTYVVVETSTGVFAHFAFGLLDKLGADWTGGEFAFGQKNSNTTGSAQAIRDGRTSLLDGFCNDTGDTGDPANGMDLFAATIHAEGLPNQIAGGQWAVCMGGRASSPQTDFGLDRQSNDGSSSDTARVNFTWGYRGGPFAQSFYRGDGSSFSGELDFWRIATSYVDSNGDIHGMPIGYMPDVFGVSIRNYGDAQTVIGSDGNTYYLFPAKQKWSGSGAETGTTGYQGIAYLKDDTLSLNPKLHAGIAGHWDFNDSSTITLGGGRVEDITDGSGNGNTLSDLALNFGPTIETVSGMDFGRFSLGAATRLVATHDATLNFGSGSFTIMFVIRSDDWTQHTGYVAAKGVVTSPADGQYDALINLDGSGVLTGTTGDTNATILQTEDPYTAAVTNRLMVCTIEFDRTGEVVNFYKNGVLSTGSGADLTGVSSHDNTLDLCVGRQSQSVGSFLGADIGELSIIGGTVTADEMTGMHNYLINKWSIVTGLPTNSPAIDPATFVGRIGHWDFSDASSITEVTSKISQIDDQETTNDLSQSTAARRPIMARLRGSLMGHFSADGLEDWLSTAGDTSPTDLADIGANSVLYIAVFRADRAVAPTDNGNTVFISGENNVNCARLFAEIDSTDGMIPSVAESSTVIDVTDGDEDVRDRTVCYAMYINREASPDELTLYFNGVETSASGVDISTVDPLNNVGSAHDGFILGTLLPGDGTFGPKLRFSGGIGEMIVIEEALTSAEIVEISHFLMNKWDITT